MARNYKRSNYKGKRDEKYSDKVENKTNRKTGDNDASWYTRNSALVADAGKIAFTWPAGSKVDLGIKDEIAKSGSRYANYINCVVNGVDLEGNFLTPGVMSLKYVPSFGTKHDGYDPLNIASQNIYSFVRHANSGHANYDPSDLMLYLMAMDQIYSLWIHLVRAYGAVRLFSQVNRNYPKVLLNAMGFDYDDVAKNLANFRYFINNCVARIGAMVVPNVMPIFARHSWMPRFVFTDSDSAKGQLYLFRPVAFGKYNEKDTTMGGCLEAEFFDGMHTVEEWMYLMDDLISRIRSSEDCGIISGDLLKAYGDNVIKLMPIDASFTTNVVYSREVLGQIQNATITPSGAYIRPTGSSVATMLYQDLENNILKSGFRINQTTPYSGDKGKAQARMYAAKHIMAGLSESPTPEEVMVNSRLMIFGTDFVVENNSVKWVPDSCGTEIVIDACIYDTQHLEGWRSATNWQLTPDRRFGYVVLQQDSDNYTSDRPKLLTLKSLLNYFDYHPMYWDVAFGSQEQNTITVGLVSDLNNYAVVNAHDIAKMHDTALLSMFDVPLMGASKAK